MALLLLGLSVFSAPMLAHADSPQPVASALPGNEEQDEDSAKQAEITKKYGQDREVAAPPMIVVPAGQPHRKFVSQPLNVAKHLLNTSHSKRAKALIQSQTQSFNANANVPVIQNIQKDAFATPEQGFFVNSTVGFIVFAMLVSVSAFFLIRKINGR